MKDAVGSNSDSSHGQENASGGAQSSEREAMLDQISVANPNQKSNQFVKDLRNLKINEKSEDTGSLQNAITPTGHQWMSPNSGDQQSKITSPLDNNASYIDKSMTRQFENLQQTPSLSQNTGSQQNVD